MRKGITAVSLFTAPVLRAAEIMSSPHPVAALQDLTLRPLWSSLSNLKAPLQKGPHKLVIMLDAGQQLSMSDEEFKRVTQEILFRSREGKDLQLHCEIPEHNGPRKQLDPKDVMLRNDLQVFFKKNDKRLRYLEDLISTLAKTGASVFSPALFGDDDWLKIFKGAVNQAARNSSYVGGSKIDIWKDKPRNILAPIWVTEEEMKSILDALRLDSPMQLALGPGMHFAGDLPREILLTKAIPAIAMTLMDEVVFQGADRNEMGKHYDFYNWYIGLG